MISSGQAKGLLSEYQSKYTSARAVYRERKKYCEEIDWNMLAVPPTGSYKVIFCFTSDALSGYWPRDVYNMKSEHLSLST